MKIPTNCASTKTSTTTKYQLKLNFKKLEEKYMLQSKNYTKNWNKSCKELTKSNEEYTRKIYSEEKGKICSTTKQNKHEKTIFSYKMFSKMLTRIFTSTPSLFKIAFLFLLFNTTVSAHSLLNRLPTRRNNQAISSLKSPSYNNFIVRLKKRSIDGSQCYIPLKKLGLLASNAVTVARNEHRVAFKRNTVFLHQQGWPEFTRRMHRELKNTFCKIEAKPHLFRKKETNQLIKTMLAMIGTLQEEMNELKILDYNPDLTCGNHFQGQVTKRGVVTELNKWNKVLNELCGQGFQYSRK